MNTKVLTFDTTAQREPSPKKKHIAKLVLCMAMFVCLWMPARGLAITALVNQPMGSAVFVNIYWDATWDSDDPSLTVSTMDAVTGAIVRSSYFNGLSEYGVTSVSFAGSFLPDPHCTQKAPSQVGFYDPFGPAIAGFIQCEHDHGPAQLRQSGVVYNIVLPPSSIESDFFTQNFCTIPGSPVAWHYHGLQNTPPWPFGGGPFSGQPIYTIVQANPQCGGNNALFESLFHEMVEAVTDPYPIDISIIPPHITIATQNEVADICEGLDPTNLSQTVIAMVVNTTSVGAPSYWSNAKQKCVNFDAKVYLLFDPVEGVLKTFLSPLPLASVPSTWPSGRKTWSHIVPGNFGGGGLGDFLFYDKAAGVAEFWGTDETGQNLALLRRYTNWSPGTTHIVPGNFGGTSATGQTDLLLYNASTGGAAFFDVWGQGNINAMKGYNNWSTGTTHIVPGNFGGTSATGQTDLLLYNASTGGAAFFDVWGQGNINAMKGYNNWSTGTTHIVPGNFGGTSATGQTDLLLYNASTGGAAFFDVWGQGNINAMKGYNNWSTGTTHIVPGNFGGTSATGQTDLLLYNATYGLFGFFDVWGHGNINPEAGYSQFPTGEHWSLIVP